MNPFTLTEHQPGVRITCMSLQSGNVSVFRARPGPHGSWVAQGHSIFDSPVLYHKRLTAGMLGDRIGESSGHQ
jgi:hypothetical protein